MPVRKFADLELGLLPQEPGSYRLDFRFELPESETDLRSAKMVAEINPDALLRFLPGEAEYGRALTQALFQDPELKEKFAAALAVCQQNDLALRLRLVIDGRAPELHDLIWESLRNPLDDTPLTTSQNICFSRYLGGKDWRPMPLRRQSRMFALVAVADPDDLEDFHLAPIDAEAEVSRARAALGNIPLTTLGRKAGGEPATLNNLERLLSQRKAGGHSHFDILYLICHGSLQRGKAWLWLEDETGKVARVSGSELATRIQELPEAPMLVVLASCESAGSAQGRALAALGPNIAQAGAPAVLAMQGKISQETSARFTGAFFRSLGEQGVVDLAASVARGEVRDRDDYWMPALFMRLRSGRIWYQPGFAGDSSDLVIWDGLQTFVEEKLCTAILGPELAKPLMGDEREIALKWADSHGYPLAFQDRGDLSRVAQYVATNQKIRYLRIAYYKALREGLLERLLEPLPENLGNPEQWRPDDLLQALELAAAARWPEAAENPYRLLAQLGLKIYITAGQDNLLCQTLKEGGAQPETRTSPWNEAVRLDPSLWMYDDEPTPERPLIYHLYGHYSQPASLVLTEDDYFDYMINMTVHRDLIPDSVSAALVDSALLFLGFQLEDWQFRVFFRMVMNQPGAQGLEQFSHVAAQIAPLEGTIQDAERARRYLQRYFMSDRKQIDLYWGTSIDFLQDLVRRL